MTNIISKNIKKFRENKGLYKFVIRTIIFFIILFSFYLFVFLYFRHTRFFLTYLSIDQQFYFEFLTGLRKSDFINSALFTIIIFIIWNRNKIKKLEAYKQNKKQTIFFGILTTLSLIIHYLFKYWVNLNQDFALSNVLLITLIKYGFNILFIILLTLTIYNLKIFREQFHKFKKQIPIFILVLIAYFFLIQLFQKIWLFLSNFVAKSVGFMLGLTFDPVYLKIEPLKAPVLGVKNFIVGISDVCSGIDSLLLFLSLYAFIFVLDWERINKKRMLILLIPGIIGTVIYNLIRVYLIILVGVFISPEFAVDIFHTNLGWILFLIFFMIFWHSGGKWIYTK